MRKPFKISNTFLPDKSDIKLVPNYDLALSRLSNLWRILEKYETVKGGDVYFDGYLWQFWKGEIPHKQETNLLFARPK